MTIYTTPGDSFIPYVSNAPTGDDGLIGYRLYDPSRRQTMSPWDLRTADQVLIDTDTAPYPYDSSQYRLEPRNTPHGIYTHLSLPPYEATSAGAGAWIYAWEGATGTLLQTSADQTTAWTTSGNVGNTSGAPVSAAMAFSTTADGSIVIGLHVPSAATYPGFGRIGNSGNGVMNFGLITFSALLGQAAKLTGSLTIPLPANTAGGSYLWAGLS